MILVLSYFGIVILFGIFIHFYVGYSRKRKVKREMGSAYFEGAEDILEKGKDQYFD